MQCTPAAHKHATCQVLGMGLACCSRMALTCCGLVGMLLTCCSHMSLFLTGVLCSCTNLPRQRQAKHQVLPCRPIMPRQLPNLMLQHEASNIRMSCLHMMPETLLLGA